MINIRMKVIQIQQIRQGLLLKGGNIFPLFTPFRLERVVDFGGFYVEEVKDNKVREKILDWYVNEK